MDDSSSPDIDRVTYWKKTIRRSLILLTVWFVAGYVMSILLAEPLNSINFGGIPFGFWMAQQGSIFVFIALILIYVLSMQQLDREAGVEEDGEDDTPPPTAH
jgi:putative solute:sodium symporter small subunit